MLEVKIDDRKAVQNIIVRLTFSRKPLSLSSSIQNEPRRLFLL